MKQRLMEVAWDEDPLNRGARVREREPGLADAEVRTLQRQELSVAQQVAAVQTPSHGMFTTF